MTHKRSIKRRKVTFTMPNLSEPHWVILRLIFDNAENPGLEWYRSVAYLKDIYGKKAISDATTALLAEKYGVSLT